MLKAAFNGQPFHFLYLWPHGVCSIIQAELKGVSALTFTNRPAAF